MTGNSPLADTEFWESKIAPEEDLIWTARMKPGKAVWFLALTFLFGTFVIWSSYQDLFVHASIEEACPTGRGKCELLYRFAWPFLMLGGFVCFWTIAFPLSIYKGWLTRRYAITQKAVYFATSGLWNQIKRVRLPDGIPYAGVGNTLKFSRFIVFAGLDEADVYAGISAVQNLRMKK